MEVRFVYDDTALYVGARMYSANPIGTSGRRDEGDQSEYLLFLDRYLDDGRQPRSASRRPVCGWTSIFRRTATMATMATTRCGWLYDRGRAGLDGGRWIPFSQLRFTDQESQVWGLNIKRWVPSRNEEVHWVLIGRTEQGLASRFGDLQGITGVRPSRRIELLPYVAGGSQVIGDLDPGDPFASGANLEGRAGVDVKVGFGSSLTLELTVNPDFGQVEADPAEVNLSAFETFFDKRRPFFVEGSNLLNGYDDNWFYSRRIGSPPIGPASGDFVDFPLTSTILGAAKLTGRTVSGMSIGMLGAVTDEEEACT